MKKIALWQNEICERGVSISTYDYAYYNQKMLGNISYILYEKNNAANVPEVIKKFEKEFHVHGCEDFSEVDVFLKKNHIDMLYIIKSGQNDGKISKIVPTFVHCVFETKQPHGDIYGAISDSVLGYESNIPVLPHMINLPNHNEDMREMLNIPKDATVFGRYGGKEQFNIIGVHHIVEKVARENHDIYFLFANTNVFCPPMKNIIHLDKIIDLHEKTRFINTCDAMLWSRCEGESFGLSLGEFSSRNKVVIAYRHNNISADFHIKTLKDRAFWFRTAEELISILTSFNREAVKHQDWNMYKEYTPEKVMAKFQELVIDGLSKYQKP